MVLSADDREVLAEMECLFHREAAEPRPVTVRPRYACAARQQWAEVAVLVAAWTTRAGDGRRDVTAAALAAGRSVSWLVWCQLV
jgi:hypothetical protein